jgi:hypothetical protein
MRLQTRQTPYEDCYREPRDAEPVVGIAGPILVNVKLFRMFETGRT